MKKEYIDLWDLKRENIIRTIVRGEEIRQDERMVSVHIYIINSKKDILIHKHSMKESNYSGYWSMFGGTVSSENTSEETVIIKIKEELGLDINTSTMKYLTSFSRKQDFVDVYVIWHDFDISLCSIDKDKIECIRWESLKNINNMIENNEFIFQPYLAMLENEIRKK